MNKDTGEKSLKDLGLTKASIQLMTNQLVRELHTLEESEETMRLLEERKNRKLKRQKSEHSRSQGTTSAKSASRQTGLHAFFTSTKSVSKKQSMVVLSDDEEPNPRASSKRKESAANGTSSKSQPDKKQRKSLVDAMQKGKRKGASVSQEACSASPEKKICAGQDDVDVLQMNSPPTING